MTEKSSLTVSRSVSRNRTCEAGQVFAMVVFPAQEGPMRMTRLFSGICG
ncbi:hypothetical protein AB0L68_40650 [Streptomyces sp. NPDC052164]